MAEKSILPVCAGVPPIDEKSAIIVSPVHLGPFV